MFKLSISIEIDGLQAEGVCVLGQRRVQLHQIGPVVSRQSGQGDHETGVDAGRVPRRVQLGGEHAGGWLHLCGQPQFQSLVVLQLGGQHQHRHVGDQQGLDGYKLHAFNIFGLRFNLQ